MSFSWLRRRKGVVLDGAYIGFNRLGQRGVLARSPPGESNLLQCPPNSTLSLDAAIGIIANHAWKSRGTDMQCPQLMTLSPEDLLAGALLLLCKAAAVPVPLDSAREAQHEHSGMRGNIDLSSLSIKTLARLPGQFWDARRTTSESRVSEFAEKMKEWLAALPTVHDMQTQAILAVRRSGPARVFLAGMQDEAVGLYAAGASAWRSQASMTVSVSPGQPADSQIYSMRDLVRFVSIVDLRADDFPAIDRAPPDGGPSPGEASGDPSRLQDIATAWLWAVACVRSRAVLRTTSRRGRWARRADEQRASSGAAAAEASSPNGPTCQWPRYRGLDLALVPCMDMLNHADAFGSAGDGVTNAIEVVGDWVLRPVDSLDKRASGGCKASAPDVAEGGTDGDADEAGDDGDGWLDDMLAGGLADGEAPGSGEGGDDCGPGEGDDEVEDEDDDGGWLDDMLAGGPMDDSDAPPLGGAGEAAVPGPIPGEGELAGCTSTQSSEAGADRISWEQVQLMSDTWHDVVEDGPWYVCSTRSNRGGTTSGPGPSVSGSSGLASGAASGSEAAASSHPSRASESARELCLSYGERSTTELLDTYGFVPGDTRGWLGEVHGTSLRATGSNNAPASAAASAAGDIDGSAQLPSRAVHLAWETCPVSVSLPAMRSADAAAAVRALGTVGCLCRTRPTKAAPVHVPSTAGQAEPYAVVVVEADIEIPCLARSPAAAAGCLRAAMEYIRGGNLAEALRPGAASTPVERAEERETPGGDSESMEMSSLLAPFRVMVEASSSGGRLPDPYSIQPWPVASKAWILLKDIAVGCLKIHLKDLERGEAGGGYAEGAAASSEGLLPVKETPPESSTPDSSRPAMSTMERSAASARSVCLASCILMASTVLDTGRATGRAESEGSGSAGALGSALGWGYAESEEFREYMYQLRA